MTWNDILQETTTKSVFHEESSADESVIRLAVRRFFCRNSDCARKIFTERLPPFVEPWAQVTTRLFEAVQAIGLATSGELGTRLADRISIHASPTTMLRRIMDLSSPATGQVTVLGVDDFSFKRGRRFGIILVDLSTHQVIDLLEERSTKSAADWMCHHPEIQCVSRDRGNDYAQAARQGAPQATPVTDRFHLVKNLVEAIEPAVARCYREMRKVQEPFPEPRVPKVKEWRPARSPALEHQYQLIACPFDHLNEDECADLQELCQASSSLFVSFKPLGRWHANAKVIDSKTGKSTLLRVGFLKCNGLRKDLNETKRLSLPG